MSDEGGEKLALYKKNVPNRSTLTGNQMMKTRSLRPSTLLCLLALLAGGCLVMSNSEERRTGKYVSQATFEQIKPGATTSAWVLATLGEPTTKTKASGSEVWKWEYTETKESGGAIFLIFGGRSTKESNGAAYVELKDGVVANAWRD
jgi:outer membrane protein assembly factor BamE (lipoprotein component of BamABCDE complex)